MTYIDDLSTIGGYGGGYESYVGETSAPAPAPELTPDFVGPQQMGDAYEAYVAPEQTSYEVLPYEAPAMMEAAPTPSSDVTSNAQTVLDGINSNASLVGDETAQQAAGALQQLLDARTEENAEQIDPAIEYWTNVGRTAIDDFGDAPDFQETITDETLAAWETVFDNAAANYEAMLNGYDDVSPEMVIEMQQALADNAYALAFGAMFEGNVPAAQQAAELALSYVASLEMAGVDTSQFDMLKADLNGLIELGVMDLTYMMDGNHAVVEQGHVTAIGQDNQAIVFDGADIAIMAGEPIPPEFGLQNPDPSMDPGFDGTGLDLSPGPTDSPSADGSMDYGQGDVGYDAGNDYGGFDAGGYDYGGDFGDTGGGGGSGNPIYDTYES